MKQRSENPLDLLARLIQEDNEEYLTKLEREVQEIEVSEKTKE